jgi:hypothetical protein
MDTMGENVLHLLDSPALAEVVWRFLPPLVGWLPMLAGSANLSENRCLAGSAVAMVTDIPMPVGWGFPHAI